MRLPDGQFKTYGQYCLIFTYLLLVFMFCQPVFAQGFDKRPSLGNGLQRSQTKSQSKAALTMPSAPLLHDRGATTQARLDGDGYKLSGGYGTTAFNFSAGVLHDSIRNNEKLGFAPELIQGGLGLVANIEEDGSVKKTLPNEPLPSHLVYFPNYSGDKFTGVVLKLPEANKNSAISDIVSINKNNNYEKLLPLIVAVELVELKQEGGFKVSLYEVSKDVLAGDNIGVIPLSLATTIARERRGQAHRIETISQEVLFDAQKFLKGLDSLTPYQSIE